MMSEEHVDRIIEEVQSSSIKDQGLKDDLIDHLSCLVEIEMKGDTSFEDAYAAAFQQTAPNGLNEIQKETIFLLNYHKIIGMKRLMYASGYLFALTWIVGIFFKIMLLPAAMTLMFVGGSGLAFVFLPLVLINRFKRSAFKVMSEKLKWILGSLSIMLLMLSSWMKLAHLQGAAVMLGLSFLLFGFGFLPFLFFRMYKRSVTEI